MMRRVQYLAASLALALAYFGAGKFGLSLASINPSASAVWPPTGLALGVLLLCGYQYWPAVFLGAFLVNVTTPGSWISDFGIAAGNTMEALVAAGWIQRFAGGARFFARPSHVLMFTLAAASSAALGASAGVLSLCVMGEANWAAYPAVWLTWWLGDLMGALVVGPLVVILATERLRMSRGQVGELGALLLTLLIIDGAVLAGTAPFIPAGELIYLAFLPVLWAAFRFGSPGSIICAGITSVIALVSTLRGSSPFVSADPNQSLLLLQVFLGVLTVTGLALAGVVREWRGAEERLERALEIAAKGESEQKRAAEALRISQERLAGLINSAMDAVITVNSSQCIVLFNPAAERMFECPAREALGSPLDRFIPQQFRQAHRQHIEKFGDTGITNRRMGALGDLSALRAGGEEFPIEASISQMELAGAKLYTVILRDVTERKKSEAALREAHEKLASHAVTLEKEVELRTAKLREALGELEAFSYSLAHDMRAPLRAMGAFAQILLDEIAAGILPPEAPAYCRRILTAAERLDRLIQDALNYAKAGSHELTMEPVDLARFLPGLIETYPNLQPEQADIHLASDLPVVFGNESLLTQCFSNLLANAVKFVPPGTRPCVRVRADVNASVARVWVEDNGIGISPHAQRRLFGMFQKLENHYEGTGIGLAIVRKVTERMGGEVGVESELGQGSRFWVKLPLAVPPPSMVTDEADSARTQSDR